VTYCNVVYCVSAGRNPTPGIIINHKHGKDVYGGVVIDYRGEVRYASPVIECSYECAANCCKAASY